MTGCDSLTDSKVWMKEVIVVFCRLYNTDFQNSLNEGSFFLQGALRGSPPLEGVADKPIK